jgi:hypothetical protein
MARKTVATVRSAPVKIDGISKRFLASEEARDPVLGCEVEWNRYLIACREQADSDARLKVISAIVDKEGGTSSAKHWPDFSAALSASQRASSAVMGSLSAYLYRVEHINDDKLVVEEELRAIVIDSLSDKLEGLQMTINSGMLGSKVAQAIRTLVIEDEAIEPPLCPDCN